MMVMVNKMTGGMHAFLGHREDRANLGRLRASQFPAADKGRDGVRMLAVVPAQPTLAFARRGARIGRVFVQLVTFAVVFLDHAPAAAEVGWQLHEGIDAFLALHSKREERGLVERWDTIEDGKPIC